MGQHEIGLLASRTDGIIPLGITGLEHWRDFAGEARCLGPRTKLVHAGRPSNGMFVLQAGWMIDFRLLRDGRRQILNFRLPGDIIGLEALSYKNALHSTGTLTSCTVAPLCLDHIAATQCPSVTSGLLLMAVREGAILHEREVNLGRKTAFPRIAHLLLELDHRLRLRGTSLGAVAPFPLTQDDIADSTGLTTPYVNRILQRMRHDGLIHAREGALELTGWGKLAVAAEFRPDYLDGAPFFRPETDTCTDKVPPPEQTTAQGPAILASGIG